jgi:CBS domain-containing protein
MVTAGEFCNRTVFIARAADSLLGAAKRMHDEHVGSLVVVEDVDGGRRPIGIITDRDILVRVLAGDPKHVGALSVGDVMSKELIRAWEDEPLLDILKRMRSYGVRRVPVLDVNDNLAGIVTFDDLVEQVADELHDLATLIGRERRREAHPEPHLHANA